MGRNFAIFRSVAFGLLTKISGAFLVFLGLPLIGTSLSANEYATFLKCMTVTSMFGLFYGAMSSVSVRDLSKALHQPARSRLQAEFSVIVAIGLLLLGFNISIFGILCALEMEAAFSSAYAIAMISIFIVGFFQIGDNYLVAARQDYITSITQLFVGILTLGSIYQFRSAGLDIIVAIYFGFPIILAAFVTAYVVCAHKLSLAPLFDRRAIFIRVSNAFFLFLNGISDYCKIYIAPLILVYTSSNERYAQLATIFLFVARLVNPVSLIARPLLPAIVDAIERNDAKWLANLRRLIYGVSFVSAVAILLFLFVIDPEIYTAIVPHTLGGVAMQDVFAAGLLLWSQGIIALVLPVYVVFHRTNLHTFINATSVLTGIATGCTLILLGYEGSYGFAFAMLNCIGAFLLIATLPSHLQRTGP